MSEEDASGGDSNGPKKPPTPAMCVAAGDYFMHQAVQGLDSTPLLKQQTHDSARKAYQQAIRVDPKLLTGYLGLAHLYIKLEDYDHALATYQKALQVAPANPLLWYEQGMCYCRKKEFPNGAQALRKAVELDPENRQYADFLGYTLAIMGRYDESLACFAKVHPAAKARYRLALILEHLKQPELCKQHLQLALQLDPQLDEARTMLAKLAGARTQPAPEGQEVMQASYQETARAAPQPRPVPPAIPARTAPQPTTPDVIDVDVRTAPVEKRRRSSRPQHCRRLPICNSTPAATKTP